MALEQDFPGLAPEIAKLRSVGMSEESIYSSIKGKVDESLKSGADPTQVKQYLYQPRGQKKEEPGLLRKIGNAALTGLDIASLPVTVPVAGALGLMEQGSADPKAQAWERMKQTAGLNTFTPSQFLQEQTGAQLPWWAKMGVDVPAYAAAGGAGSAALRGLRGVAPEIAGGGRALEAGAIPRQLGPAPGPNWRPGMGMPPSQLGPGQPAGLLQERPMGQLAAPRPGIPQPPVPSPKMIGAPPEQGLLGEGRTIQVGPSSVEPYFGRSLRQSADLGPVEQTLDAVMPPSRFPHTQPLSTNPEAGVVMPRAVEDAYETLNRLSSQRFPFSREELAELTADIKNLYPEAVGAQVVGSRARGTARLEGARGYEKTGMSDVDVSIQFPKGFRIKGLEDTLEPLWTKWGAKGKGQAAVDFFLAHGSRVQKPAVPLYKKVPELSKADLEDLGHTDTLFSGIPMDAIKEELKKDFGKLRSLLARGKAAPESLSEKELNALGAVVKEVKSTGAETDLGKLVGEYKELSDKLMSSLRGGTLYSGLPIGPVWDQAKGWAKEAINIWDRNIGSPYFFLGKSQLGKAIVDRLYAGDHEANSFLRNTADEFLGAVKGVKAWSDVDLNVGKALDKGLEGGFKEKTHQKLYTAYRSFMDRTGQELVDKGILPAEKLVKENYFHRRWGRIQTPEKWEQDVRADITNLEAELELSKAVGKELPGAKVRQLAQAKKALEHFTTSGSIFHDYVPTRAYAPFLKNRTGATGYEFSAINSWHTYAHQFAKKVYREPAAKDALEMAKKMVDPKERTFAQSYIKRFMDAPQFEKQWNSSLENLSRMVMTFEWMKDMGGNLRSALINSTQSLNTVFDQGPGNLAKAVKAYTLNEIVPGTEGIKKGGMTARELFQYSGHGQDIPWQFQYLKYDPMMTGGTRAWMKAQEAGGYIFNKMEMGNRAGAFLAGWYNALDKGIKGHQALKAAADEAVKRTQFLYGKIGSPMATSGPLGRMAMQFATFPVKQVELYRKWASEGPKGVAKLVGNLTFAELAMGEGMHHLGIDLSTAVGLGFKYEDIVKGLSSYFVEGDAEKAKAHLRMGTPALFGGPGGGILPSGFFPSLETAKSVLSGDYYRLIPVQIGRVLDGARSYAEGPQVDPVTGEVGYAVRGRMGGPRGDEKMGTLNAAELASRTFGPKTAKEQEWQFESFREKEENKAVKNMTKVVKKLMQGDESDVERAFQLMEKWNVNPFSGMPQEQVKKEVGVMGRAALRRQSAAGRRAEGIFNSDTP